MGSSDSYHNARSRLDPVMRNAISTGRLPTDPASLAKLPPMAFRNGSIEGLLIFQRPTQADERGFFREAFRMAELEEALGHRIQFLQTNHSRSTRGVLRGLHAENWEKLVYVPNGEVFTAVADIRPDSPTFGQLDTFWFKDSYRPTLFLPRGLAHGYCVVSDSADYVYQVTAYYDGTDTRAVAWDDADLDVPWPIETPILSPRDQRNPTLRELFPERFAELIPA